MDKIFNEDCRVTLQRNLPYHYVVQSPPDFKEIGLEADDHKGYKKFLYATAEHLNPINRVVTYSTPDRKGKGGVQQKHVLICEVMRDLGWNLMAQKIWVVSYKVNLYGFNYRFLLTFNKKGYKFNRNPVKLPDVFYDDTGRVRFEGGYTFSVEVVKQHIRTFSQPGDTVADFFMGVGSTAIACLESKRHYLGSEIDRDTYKKAKSRINTHGKE